MYLKRLFSDEKTKLVYSNGRSQMHFCCPFSDSSNRTTHKTCLRLSIETHKKRRLGKEGAATNIAERQTLGALVRLLGITKA